MKLEGFAFISEVVLGRQFAAPGQAPADPRFVPGETFQIAKTGTFFSPVYGKVTLTAQDLTTMFQNFKMRTPRAPTQLPIDYDHLSDDPKKPEDGKAAGWVEDLEVRDAGNTLWARPKWTKRAAQLLSEGAYRWCSPYFLVDYLDKDTGQKIGPTLKAVAITNRPFLEGMAEIPAPAIAMSEKIERDQQAAVSSPNDERQIGGGFVLVSDAATMRFDRQATSTMRAFSELARIRREKD